MTPIHVFILAEVRLYEEGLARVLSSEGRFRVVGTAGTCQEGLEHIASEARRPHVVLIAVGPPAGFDAARLLRATAPDVRLVALGVGDRDEEVLGWAEAGVSGFVTREMALAGLMEAIELVARHGVVCSPEITTALLKRLEELAAERESTYGQGRLTAREREIVALIERGMANKQIALELHLSLATVKNHVHSILEKLAAKSRSEAAAAMHGRLYRSATPTSLPRT